MMQPMLYINIDGGNKKMYITMMIMLSIAGFYFSVFFWSGQRDQPMSYLPLQPGPTSSGNPEVPTLIFSEPIREKPKLQQTVKAS
jgi:hypothetical protein